jgi:hypothetical protein
MTTKYDDRRMGRAAALGAGCEIELVLAAEDTKILNCQF